MAKVSAEMSW